MQSSTELKPCPFCGPGQSVVECYQSEYGSWKVGCGRCGSSTGFRPARDPKAREHVVASWNSRPCEELAEKESDNLGSSLRERAKYQALAEQQAEAAEKENKRLNELVESFEKHTLPVSNDGNSVFIDGAGDVEIDHGGRLRWHPIETAPTDRPFLAAEFRPTSWAYHVREIDPRRHLTLRRREIDLEYCKFWTERLPDPRGGGHE